MWLLWLLWWLWLLWLFQTRLKEVNKCHCYLIGKGALDNEELFVVEGSENWRSTPGQPEEREKCGKTAENPLHRRQPPEGCTVCTVGTRLCCELECLQTLAMN